MCITLKGNLTGFYGLASVLELEGLMRNHMHEWIVGGKTLVIGSQGWVGISCEYMKYFQSRTPSNLRYCHTKNTN